MTIPGCTYFGAENPLVETFEFVAQRVTEQVEVGQGVALAEEAGAKPGKRMVLEGVFQRADTQNLNKRVYPRAVWERLLGEKSPVMQRVRERAMVGHLEHPTDGTTDLNKAAVVISALRLKEDGTVWGQLVVLNTPAGKVIQELVDAGVKIGISSRGTGSVDTKGVVQDDYNVDTWDIVYNPSTPGAHPMKEHTAPKANVAEAAAAAEVLPAPSNATPPVSLPPSGGADRAMTMTLVQQFLVAGPDAVRARTGVSNDNDLSMVLQRALSWLTQHGEYKSLDEFWTAFLKVYPLMAGAKSEDFQAVIAAGDKQVDEAGKMAPPFKKKGDKDKDGDDDGDEDDGEEKNSKAKPGDAGAKKGEKDGDEKDEAAPAAVPADLVAEAKDEIVRLRAENAQLAETKVKMTADVEASAAIIGDLREQVRSLQETTAKLTEASAKAQRVIAALTSVDGAGEVRDAVESAVKSDARLEGHRSVLGAQKTPAAVEAKAKAILDTLQESVATATGSARKAQTLEERIRQRRRVLEARDLPTGVVMTESAMDAGEVSEAAVERLPTSKAARLCAAAVPALRRAKGLP